MVWSELNSYPGASGSTASVKQGKVRLLRSIDNSVSNATEFRDMSNKPLYMARILASLRYSDTSKHIYNRSLRSMQRVRRPQSRNQDKFLDRQLKSSNNRNNHDHRVATRPPELGVTTVCLPCAANRRCRKMKVGIVR